MYTIENYGEKIIDFLKSFKPFGAVMVIDNSTNHVEVFDYPHYMDSARFIMQIVENRVLNNLRKNESPFTKFGSYKPELLLNSCINEKDFGDILGLYVQDGRYNFIRICYP